jgi:hypothetical protein
MKRFLLAAVALIVLACGGGSGNDNDAITHEPGPISTLPVVVSQSTPTASPSATPAPAAAQVTSTPATPLPRPTATRFPATPTSAPATATPTTVAATADVQLGEWNLAQAPRGNTLYVIGEVFNKGDAMASDITVAVSVYDARGRIIGSATALYILRLIPSGAMSPFRAEIHDMPLDAVADTRIQIQYGTSDSTEFLPDFFSIDLEILQVNWTAERIVGEFVNVGDRPLEHAFVLLIGYDEDGSVIAVETVNADLDRIEPAMTSAFSTSHYRGAIPARWHAVAQGIVAR